MYSIRLFLSGLVLLALSCLPASAQSVSSGDVTVHYNAIPTTMLTPKVAQQYGITRSAGRALLNISVRKGAPGADSAVPSVVTAAASNLSGQRQSISLREIKDGGAVYYLGEVRVSGNETLNFEVEVTPADRHTPIRVNFRQEFFVN